MGVKEFIINKKSNFKEKDIVKVINDTLAELQAYLIKLESAQIHDIEQCDENSANRECAERIIQFEIAKVSQSIQSLKDTKKAIIKGRVIEESNNYNFGIRDIK